MIRNHRVFEIKYRFRMQIRRSDDTLGYEHGLSEHKFTVLAPSEEIARAWAKSHIEKYKDSVIDSVTNLGCLDACILEQIW